MTFDFSTFLNLLNLKKIQNPVCKTVKKVDKRGTLVFSSMGLHTLKHGKPISMTVGG